MSVASRLFAAGLAVALLLTLTPCCNTYADIPARSTTNLGSDHDHDALERARPAGGPNHFHGPCMKWLGQTNYAVDSLHVALISGPDSPHNVPITSLLWVMPGAERMVAPRPSYHPPPVPALALYLRLEHLRL